MNEITKNDLHRFNQCYLKSFTNQQALMRDVVSDADKLEAVGKSGLERCIEYQKEIHPDLSERERMDKVIEHGYDKLFYLDDYMHTPFGKELGRRMIKEMTIAMVK